MLPLARHEDPIVAIATASGRGAVGIVRVSGASLMPLAQAICGRALAPRQATYTPFLDASGVPIDQGLAIFFPAGLVLYWLTNNILSIAQQYLINKRLGVLGK